MGGVYHGIRQWDIRTLVNGVSSDNCGLQSTPASLIVEEILITMHMHGQSGGTASLQIAPLKRVKL